MRNGQQFLDSLDDRRAVFVNGERVANVRTHPAFRGICRTLAQLYDFAADPANDMQVTDATSGQAVNVTATIPRSREDLARRRQASRRWAEQTLGLVGRGPDHVAGFVAGFAGAAELFDRGGRPLGTNVAAFQRRLLLDDLYVSYVIVPPQVDRSTTAQGYEEQFLQVGVVRETDGGIVVRGSQMLGTGAPISNWLFVSCIKPLRPGDEDYALSFVVPIGAAGLKLYCRRPYAVGQPSRFDYPLSTRFDEIDALVVFDDVFVPWEQVFVYRDVELCRAQFFETAAHVLGNTQAQVRLAVKMQLALGLARQIAATNRIDQFPPVQEKLSELAALAAIVEGMILAAESSSQIDRFGVARPEARYLYGVMALQAELYPRALHLLRELAGGGLLQLPSSSHDLLNPAEAADLNRYIRSPGVSAEQRVKLFKLAWDLVGSEFGGRHHQYEMFYAGTPVVAKGYLYRNYRFEEAVGLVNRFLDGYGLDDAEPE